METADDNPQDEQRWALQNSRGEAREQRESVSFSTGSLGCEQAGEINAIIKCDAARWSSWPVFSGVQMLQGRKSITLLSPKGFEILCA